MEAENNDSNDNKDQEFYRQLVERFADDQSTEQELEAFFHLLKEGRLDPQLVASMSEAEPFMEADSMTEDLAYETANIPIPAESPIPAQRRISRRIPSWTRIAAAAILIGIIAAGIWRWLGHPEKTPDNRGGATAQKIIAPGTNKAILTLSGDSTIILDNAQTGMLTRQGNADIRKAPGGRLIYTPSKGKNTTVVYNTVTTPRGGEYQIVLPDGSKVWLNAASSIRFPTAFTGTERRIFITGEAYFEIAKDPSRPFIVSIDNSTSVQVLGTDFNIMAYPDEPAIKATLIRGSIKVLKGPSAKLLHPGEQAQVDNQINPLIPKIMVHPADTAAAIAWTTGFFQFENLDIHPIMRQIARWYDVDVVYDQDAAGKLANRHFGGRISRHLNLSDVLAILAANQIHFRIDRTTIHVLP